MKHIILTTCAVISLILSYNCVPVQAEEKTSLTIESFIASTDKDYSLENHQELVDYMEHASSSTPLIDKVELRTKTDDFEIAKQQYALRFYPKGIGETKYNRELTSTIAESYDLEHQVYFNQALSKRYNLIIEYFEALDLLGIYQELNDVYSDRVSVLKKQSGTLEFDVGEYIKAENQYTELQLDIVKTENKLTGLKHKIHLTAGSDFEISFDRASLIDVAEIERMVKILETTPCQDNIYLRDRQNKISRELMKYNIEKAQSRDYISYLEVEFDQDNQFKPRKAYSLDVAIKLPFINSDQEDINRRRVNYIEEKLRYEDEKRDTDERIKSRLRSLDRYIHQYKILAERKNRDDGQNPLDIYMKMEGINPLSLLDMRENIIRYDRQQKEIYASILYEYVELLDLMGKLSEAPLRVYITCGSGAVK